MKLRVRHEKKTKVLSINDEPLPTVGSLKTEIKEIVFQEWQFSQDQQFQVSLDGKNSVGEDNSTLKDCGLVSGDLIKLVFAGNVNRATSATAVESQPTTSVQTPVAEVVSQPSESVSMMSVSQDEPATSSQETFEEIPCFSPGPIFFRDCDGRSEVPHLVQKIYENDSVKNDFQALCIVLHFMMCESGFYIDGLDDHLDILPLLQPRLFVVEYCHSAGPNLKLSFSCNPLGSFILVNSVVHPCSKSSEQVITLQVVTKEFITQSFDGSSKNSNAAAVYKDLSKLNRQVKETIAHPALNNMREELQLPPVVGLLSLFPEILQFILSYLDHKSLIALSQVNKALKEFSNDDNLWRSLYIRDFKSHPISRETSWKEMYAKRISREREHRRVMERRYREERDPYFIPPHFPAPGFAPVPFPEQPFGIIGGDHDLNPQFPYGPFANPPRRLPPGHRPFNPDNPLPGSRYDPMYPGGGFRPGRGGGMMDSDFDGFDGPSLPFSSRPGRSRNNQRFGFL